MTEEHHNIRLKSDKKDAIKRKPACTVSKIPLIIPVFLLTVRFDGKQKKRIYVRREGEDEEIIKKFGKYLLSSTYI